MKFIAFILLKVGPKQRPVRKKRRKRRKNREAAGTELMSDQTDSSSESSLQSQRSESPQPLSPLRNEYIIHEESVEISEHGSESDERRKDGLTRSKSSAPLCPCTETTVEDVVFMALSLGVRHSLSWVAQLDILKMVKSIFKRAKIPMSQPTYLKYLDLHPDENIKYHIFCDTCDAYLGEKVVDTDKVVQCTTDKCSRQIPVCKPSNFFVSLSIESQLQTYLKDDKFVNNVLSHRFNREVKHGVLSDIYDGEMYKKFSSGSGILSSPYNFSYTFFTDGVAFGKSNKTIWPIYLSINELPYEERTKYLILAAVYAGSKDPNQLYFLQPFVNEANKLSRTGISWVHKEKVVTSLVIPLCFVADSVARYQMLNFQTFHAYFGCTFCYQEAESVRGGVRFMVTVPAEERTNASWRSDLMQVLQNQLDPLIAEKDEPHRGVKGPSTLCNLDYFTLSFCVVDYMHGILGVVKTHMELIIQNSRKNMWVGLDKNIMGIEHIIHTVDSRIKSIQSNTTVVRELRLFKDLKYWKASEFKSWLLFYCIPCLTGILKDKYVKHLAMLSKATFLLLQKSVTLDDLEEAHRLFILYSFYFQEYFGEDNLTYNVHLLRHIFKGIFNFGPMWGHNSFPFESQNRFLVLNCKSPFSVASQLARKFLVFRSLPMLCKTSVHSLKTLEFSEKLLNHRKLVNCVRSNSKCILLGSPKYFSFSNEDKLQISQNIFQGNFDAGFSYEKIIYCQKRYTTETYSVGKDNNDSCAFLLSGQCVLIKHIIRIPDIDKVLLYVQKIQVSSRPLIKGDNFSFDTMRKVIQFSDHGFIKVESLHEPCFLVKRRGGDAHVCRIPYGCTVE